MHNTSVPLYWRNIEKRNKLVGKRGKIISYTYVCDLKNYLALVELEDKSKSLGQIVEASNISIGARVEAIIRRINADSNKGLIHYGIKFRLL